MPKRWPSPPCTYTTTPRFPIPRVRSLALTVLQERYLLILMSFRPQNIRLFYLRHEKRCQESESTVWSL